MNNLQNFYYKIPNTENLNSAGYIPYFVYFCENFNTVVKAKDIVNCFNDLRIKPYSNIPQYLKNNSGKKDSIFFKMKDGYVLSLSEKKKIEKEINHEQEVFITNNLFDISILETIPNIPYYLILIAKEMCGCYDCGLYTACLSMMRKLIETLIIEKFEQYNLDDKIKDKNGYFFHLSILIEKYENSQHWNTSINLRKSFHKIKKYGDLSVHNRRFFAKKSDIDKIKDDLRIAIQEIVLSINY